MTVLLVIFTILLAVGIQLLIARMRRPHKPKQVIAPRIPAPMADPRVPQGVFVDGAHSWVRITSEGLLRVGIDDFLAEALGDIESVQVPPRGAMVKRGEPLLTLRVKGRHLVVPAPVNGEVVAVNQRTVAEPWSMAQDPYGVGWAVGLWTRDRQDAIRPLRIGPPATAFAREEMTRFADFLMPSAGPGMAPMLADGGAPGRGTASQFDDERWKAFQRSFVSEAPATHDDKSK